MWTYYMWRLTEGYFVTGTSRILAWVYISLHTYTSYRLFKRRSSCVFFLGRQNEDLVEIHDNPAHLPTAVLANQFVQLWIFLDFFYSKIQTCFGHLNNGSMHFPVLHWRNWPNDKLCLLSAELVSCRSSWNVKFRIYNILRYVYLIICNYRYYNNLFYKVWKKYHLSFILFCKNFQWV